VADRPRGRFTIASIVGTRPEAIKMVPVARAIAARGDWRQVVLLTGQHDGLAPAFESLAETIALDADPFARTVTSQRSHFRKTIGGSLAGLRPNLALVQGDTTSALAGVLAARDLGIPIGHVEAGLRSFDRRQPWPEEGHRIRIDAIADLLFAPTDTAAANLRAERVDGRIAVTGNTGIDALFAALRALPPADPGRPRTLLVTCHRRENRGDRLDAICAALRSIAASLPVEIVLPLHPNPLVAGPIAERLASARDIRLIPAVDYSEMAGLMRDCWAMLTDSGGLQEEGAAIGRPVLVLRDRTERAEALDTGNILLVGSNSDRIVGAVADLIADPALYARMARPSNVFGDGRAAPRIIEAIAEWVASPVLARFAPIRDRDGDDDMVPA